MFPLPVDLSGRANPGSGPGVPGYAVLAGVPALSAVNPVSSLAHWLKSSRCQANPRRLRAGGQRLAPPGQRPGARPLTCDVVEQLRVDLRKLALQDVHVRRHDSRPRTPPGRACAGMRQRCELWEMTFVERLTSAVKEPLLFFSFLRKKILLLSEFLTFPGCYVILNKIN